MSALPASGPPASLLVQQGPAESPRRGSWRGRDAGGHGGAGCWQAREPCPCTMPAHLLRSTAPPAAGIPMSVPSEPRPLSCPLAALGHGRAALTTQLTGLQPRKSFCECIRQTNHKASSLCQLFDQWRKEPRRALPKRSPFVNLQPQGSWPPHPVPPIGRLSELVGERRRQY